MSVNHFKNKKNSATYIKLFLLVVFLLPGLVTAHKNSSSIEYVISNRLLSDIKITTYQKILQESGGKYIWFDAKGITLTGLSLNSVLADLGWYEVINHNTLSKDQYLQHDQFLTAGFLQLININDHKNSLVLINAESVLLTALKQQSEDELLFSLLPEYDQVTHLRKAISDYRHLSINPWPKLTSNFQPKLGQSHAQVKGIRKILTLLGDLPVRAQKNNRRDVYDSVVVKALKKFQKRHALIADGKLNSQTYVALQITPAQRITQLQKNLRRWFTLPNRPPQRYLLVNIPSYKLSVIEKGSQRLQMKVIVGDIENQTPLLRTQIDRITLNPSWTPTANIINNDLIPNYQKDFLFLKRNNFQLVKGFRSSGEKKEIDKPYLNLTKLLQDYRLVQAPGKNNALGYYRFNIPNNQAIYLHDTPHKSLFNQTARALSHGCVRLQNAPLLAKYLLSVDDDDKKKAMLVALQSGKTLNVPLHTVLPVYITYQTIWFDKHGTLHFSPDIYGFDELITTSSAIHTQQL